MEQKAFFAIGLGVTVFVTTMKGLHTFAAPLPEALAFSISLLLALESGWCFYQPGFWRACHGRPFIFVWTRMFGNYKDDVAVGASWTVLLSLCIGGWIAFAMLLIGPVSETVLTSAWYHALIGALTYDTGWFSFRDPVEGYAGIAMSVAMGAALLIGGFTVFAPADALGEIQQLRDRLAGTSTRRFLFPLLFLPCLVVFVMTAPFWMQWLLTLIGAGIAVVLLSLTFLLVLGSLHLAASFQMAVVTAGVACGSIGSYLFNATPVGMNAFLLTIALGSLIGAACGQLAHWVGRLLCRPGIAVYTNKLTPWEV